MKTNNYLFYKFNIVAAEAVATRGFNASSAAATILI